MLYSFYALLALAAGWALTTYAMSEFRLGDVESFLVGSGIGLVCAHGILLLLLLFLPFVAAFDLSLALVGGGFLYLLVCLNDFQLIRKRIRAQLSVMRIRLRIRFASPPSIIV